MASSFNSPCAACKFLRRKCSQECVFAPYFPPDQPQKFSNVHKVFGASNVAKLLTEMNPSQREEAASTLAHDAEARVNDPIYGCVGDISILQQHLRNIQNMLHTAKKELEYYVRPNTTLPLSHPHNFLQQMQALASSVGPSIPTPAGPSSQGVVLLHEQQQQMLETQQLASTFVAREQEMLRNYEQQQQELARLNSGFEGIGGGQIEQGFNQMNPASPSTLELVPYDNSFQAQQQQQQVERERLNPHHQHMQQQYPFLHQQNPQRQQRDEHQFLQQQNPQHQQSDGSEEGRSLGPTP